VLPTNEEGGRQMGDMVIYIRNVYVPEEKRKQVELFYLRLSIILAEIQ